MKWSKTTPADRLEAERRIPKNVKPETLAWGRCYKRNLAEIRFERSYRALVASAPPITTKGLVRSSGTSKPTKRQRKADRRVAKWDAAYADLPGYVQR